MAPRPGEATVQMSWTKSVIDAAERCGLPRAQLLIEAELDPRALDELNARVPYWQHAKLWTAMERLGAPDDFGLRLALATNGPAALDLAGFIMRHCSTLAEAVEKLRAYGG